MPLHPSWADIALRLALTLGAGMLIGIDRGERGHAAGLRTTTLVALAAAIAMIQMNLLLPVGGKAIDSFSVMDIMRLPLGVLSGMGFIGAGAILRKGDVIDGVTTAATLWLVTVIGLCLGGGQLLLGIVGTALAWTVLYVFKRLDLMILREQNARLVIYLQFGARIERELDLLLDQRKIRHSFVDGKYAPETGHAQIVYDLRWRAAVGKGEPRDLVDELLELPGVQSIFWNGT